MTQATGLRSLGDHLIRAVKLLQTARQQVPRPHPDLDPMAYPLLFSLRTPQRLSTVAATLHSDVSTVSRQVSALVGHGFVGRSPDPEDGRAQVLTLTEDGARVLDALRQHRDAWVDEITAAWSEQDKASFATYLDRFSTDLEAHLTSTKTTHKDHV